MSMRPELNIWKTLNRFPPELTASALFTLASFGKRDFVGDADGVRLKNHIRVEGVQNLRPLRDGPAYIVCNHPSTEVLVEGLLTLASLLADGDLSGRRDMLFVSAAEIPTGDGNVLFGSIPFMKRFAAMYNGTGPENRHILLVPNIRSRTDYTVGRAHVREQISSWLAGGGVLVLAPEGDWGKNLNQTLPAEKFHHNAGQIAIDTATLPGSHVLAVGICVDAQSQPYLNIGEPFTPRSRDKVDVTHQIAEEIRTLLPATMIAAPELS